MHDQARRRHRELRSPAAGVAPLAALIAGATLAAAVGCAATPPPPSSGTDGSARPGWPEAGGPLDAASPPDIPAEAVTSGPDADPVLPAELRAPAPPEVACAGDAGAAEDCELPPSVCAGPTTCDAGADVYACGNINRWLVYYEHPRCVHGGCVWDQSFFECTGASLCSEGGCTYIGGT